MSVASPHVNPAPSPPVSRPEPSAPPYRPNAFTRWFSARFFRHVQLDERWVESVREAASHGTVVYIVGAVSVLDFLCLDYLTKQFALPLVRFVNELLWWRPQAKRSPEAALVSVLEAQGSALLFLRRPPSLGRTASSPFRATRTAT